MRRVLAFLFCLLAAPSWALSPAQEIILLGGSGQSYYASPAATGKLPPWLSYASAGVRYYFDAAGNLQTSPNNLILNSAVFSTQTVAVTSGASYILSATMPSGNSIAATGGATTTLSGTGAGSRVYTSFTASSASVTLTLTGAAAQSQLEQVTAAQTAPNPFMPTTGSAYYGPVINDHNPSTLASLGLRSEPQRTNSVHNSALVGAANGAITNVSTWTESHNTGITPTIVNFGTDSGIPFVDVQYSGTATGGGNNNVFFDMGTDIAALTGQTWSNSVYIKLAAGALTNISSIKLVTAETNSVGGTVTFGTLGITPTGANLASQRNVYTRTLSGGGTVANVLPSLQVNPTGAGAVNLTLRIGLPALEQNPFATSPILTYGSAVTVPADNWSFTGAALAQIKTGSACIAIEGLAEGLTTNNRWFNADDGVGTNVFYAYAVSPTSSVDSAANSGGSAAHTFTAGGDVTTAKRRLVASIGSGQLRSSYDGQIAQVTTQGSPVGITEAVLGNTNLVANLHWYGWFSQIMIRPSCTAQQVQRYSTAGANLRGN